MRSRKRRKFSLSIPGFLNLFFLPLFSVSFFLSMEGAGLAQKGLKPHVHTQILIDRKSVEPDRDFLLGVEFQIEKGWHIYWVNPGDSGLPTSIKWKTPAGFLLRKLQWPTPKKFQSKDLITFGYENEALIFVLAQPPWNYSSRKKNHIRAHVEWLACKETCIPGKSNIHITLPPPPEQVQPKAFKKSLRIAPHKFLQWNISAHAQKDHITLSLTIPEIYKEKITNLEFYSRDVEAIDQRAEQNMEFKNNRVLLHLKIYKNAQRPIKKLNGVLIASTQWEKHKNRKNFDIEVPILSQSASSNSN